MPKFRISFSRQFAAALLCFTPSLVCLTLSPIGISNGLLLFDRWRTETETQAYTTGKVGSSAAIVAHLFSNLRQIIISFSNSLPFPEDDFHPSAGSYWRLDRLCSSAFISYSSPRKWHKIRADGDP